MTNLAEDVQTYTGFENFGIPFCLTIEAEVLGSDVTMAHWNASQRLKKKRSIPVSDVTFKPSGTMGEKPQGTGRAAIHTYIV